MTTDLPASLRAHARGLLVCEAAVELLLGANCRWLARGDFVAGFVHTCPGPDGDVLAVIDWAGAIDAARAGRLPCSGGEQQILRLSASLADGILIDLGDAVTGLDGANLDLVAAAVLHAGGRRGARDREGTS